MRRRICLVGAALSAGSLTLGVAPALAAKSKTSKQKQKPVVTVCNTNVGIMIGPGDTDVTPPVANGREYGTATCGKVLGPGVQSDRFTIPDSGDTMARFTLFFRSGELHGKYDLTPGEGSANFLETDFTGTMTVTGGSGAFFGAKGTGTMTCQTLDSIHTSCRDKLKLTKL